VPDELPSRREIAVFESDSGAIQIRIDESVDTVWATQKEIAGIFGVTLPTVNEHIKKLVTEGEIDSDATIRNFRIVQTEGERRVEREVLHLNLDAILAIGYRVSSVRATKFRKWATKTLSDVLLKGYAVDERRLAQNPEALMALADIVRKHRTSEKSLYRAMRDIFKEGSADYQANSPEAKKFFAHVQDMMT